MPKHTVGVCPDGKIAYLSHISSAARKAGLDTSSIIGLPFWEFVIPSQQARLRSAFSEARLTGSVQTVECESIVGGERERWRSTYHPAPRPIAVMIHAERIMEHDDACLTHRERQIVQLMIADHTVEQIAAIMHVTESTVTTHQQNIRAKVGCQTNAGVAVWGVRAGLQPSVG